MNIKQVEIKIEPRIKLNYNIHVYIVTLTLMTRIVLSTFWRGQGGDTYIINYISLVTVCLTIILQNCAEYHLILSRRGRRLSWLNQGIFRKIEQDNCFIIEQILIGYHFQNKKTMVL